MFYGEETCTEICKLLLEMNWSNSAFLGDTWGDNRTEIAIFIIENGADPSYYPDKQKRHTKFHIASDSNNYNIITTLEEFYRKKNAAKFI